MSEIRIVGASKHNLKNISLRIPKNKMITVTGVSGSGKSSLVYDTIFQEGQRKYLESISLYARQFMRAINKPEVRSIEGISPTISIDQKYFPFSTKSTVGTLSGIHYYLRLLYSKAGKAKCPNCGEEMAKYHIQKLVEYIFNTFLQKSISIFAPIKLSKRQGYKDVIEKFIRRGFLKVLINGHIYYLDESPKVTEGPGLAILIDTLQVSQLNLQQIKESLSLAVFESQGEVLLKHQNEEYFFSDKLHCQRCRFTLNDPTPETFSIRSLEVGYSESQFFYFKGNNIYDLQKIEIRDLFGFFKNLQLTDKEKIVLEPIIPQITQRLETFMKLNMGYINLGRKTESLSGGEIQRVRLVSQLGYSLSGVIYLIDEPSIGMHGTEQRNLLCLLKQIKNRGNTVIIVEHDASTMRACDYIIDVGPASGEFGGRIIYAGTYKGFENVSESLTSDYLFSRKKIIARSTRRVKQNSFITFSSISVNNLKNIDVKIPRDAFTVVCGVSGSGKSSLLYDAIYPIFRQIKVNYGEDQRSGLTYGKISGITDFNHIFKVTQHPIGRNVRSCPATFLGMMPLINALFAGLSEARVRGYSASRFSYNVPGGRCEACKGLGYKKVDMNFLPDLEITCPVCEGKKYDSEILKIKYKGLSISDVLDLTATEANVFFKNIPPLSKKLKTLLEVGLGYLRLGQSTSTLSGGESQRIKLCKELSKGTSKGSLYLLDEPSIGLHFDEIQRLINLVQALVNRGATVAVIEHNLDIIKAADYIIDLGPGGGKDGGKIVYQGKLEGILLEKNSKTGACLKEHLSGQ
jgi:excinuclease ABC subunit A